MLRKSDWILDVRPIKERINYGPRTVTTWDEWLRKHPSAKEQWLMSIIELLLKHQDWAGAYLLIQTYITTCKQTESNRYYNRTPFDESVHIRAVRHWFWSLVEDYGFALPEEEVPYDEQNIGSRRSVEKKAAESYPFVGGKPKRRYSESLEFFQQVEADRKLNTKFRASK